MCSTNSLWLMEVKSQDKHLDLAVGCFLWKGIFRTNLCFAPNSQRSHLISPVPLAYSDHTFGQVWESATFSLLFTDMPFMLSLKSQVKHLILTVERFFWKCIFDEIKSSFCIDSDLCPKPSKSTVLLRFWLCLNKWKYSCFYQITTTLIP